MTLPQSEIHIRSDSDVLGIHDDALFLNSLRYVDKIPYIWQAIRGTVLDHIPPALHFSSGNLTSELQNVQMAESTDLENTVPPLQLHLEYGKLLRRLIGYCSDCVDQAW